MSDQQDRSRPPPLHLDSHSDVPDGLDTQSTIVSEVQREAARLLRPIPRPGSTCVSSTEPSLNSVPGLVSNASSELSTDDFVSSNPLYNFFAAPAARHEREQNESQIEEPQGTISQASPQPDNTDRTSSSVQAAPTPFYFPYEADAERERILREGAIHNQILHNGITEQASRNGPSTAYPPDLTTPLMSSLDSSTTPVPEGSPRDACRGHDSSVELVNMNAVTVTHALAPQMTTQACEPSSPIRLDSFGRNTLLAASQADLSAITDRTSVPVQQPLGTEDQQDRLPPRPEPRADTTWGRFQRSRRHIFRRGVAIHDEAIEMDSFQGSPIQEQDHQREGDRLQAQTPVVQQVHVAWWKWLGFTVIGAGTVVVIYGAVTKFGKLA